MEVFAARTEADVGGEDSSSGVPERREIHARCNMHGHAVRPAPAVVMHVGLWKGWGLVGWLVSTGAGCDARGDNYHAWQARAHAGD